MDEYEDQETSLSHEQDELFEHHRIEITKGQVLMRIDKFLVITLPNVSRNRIQQVIDTENILVNDKPVKANYKIKPGDVIRVVMPSPVREVALIPQNIPIEIVYEDEALVIVNKPANMVVHPAYGNYDGTLMNAMVYHFENLPQVPGVAYRPGLVHRIDKHTSGLLVIAKTEASMTILARMFYERNLDRLYLALVWGNVKEDEGTIIGNIGRSEKDRKVFQVYKEEEKGKHAITHYKVLKRYGFVTLITCKLETGRTHQIRVHLKHIGHPLFNDLEYGGDAVLRGEHTQKYKAFVQNCFSLLTGQALHAKTLAFDHPITGLPLKFDSELPEAFQTLLQKWDTYYESRQQNNI
ncbi:MAG: hypothetical protein RIQ89_1816 [Bacteroidota bacterium]|jgi:23S rRNA pseudouridine1911/1915/1917 synthase